MNPTVVTAAAWVPSSFTVMVPWCLNCFKMERKRVRFCQLGHRGIEHGGVASYSGSRLKYLMQGEPQLVRMTLEMLSNHPSAMVMVLRGHVV